MLYSLDKIKSLIQEQEVISVRLSSWNTDFWASLDYEERSFHLNQAVFLHDGAYKIAEDLPMSATFYRRMYGPLAMLEDGSTITLDDANESPGLMVYRPSVEVALRHAARFARAEAKKNWLLAHGLGTFVTTGFELETQASNGHTKSSYDVLDFSVFAENADLTAAAISENATDDTQNLIAGLSRDKMLQVLEIIGPDKLGIAWPPSMVLPVSPDLLEVDTDGSVDGFEFRTVGGLTEERFKDAVTQAFKFNHKIDHRCSFHIHVGSSKDKFRMPYSEHEFRIMIEHIITHPDLPETVRERFANDKSNYFIKVNTTGGPKDSFIRRHPQGTLEFRCFGNIRNEADAMTCRSIALEAITFAVSSSKVCYEPTENWVKRMNSLMKPAQETQKAS